MNGMMPYRYQTLQTVMRGWERTGVPLVGTDGTRVWPEPLADGSPGYYAVVPFVARSFGLPLDAAILAFTLGAAGAALALGVAGCWLLFRAAAARAASAVGLLLVCGLAAYFGDVYVMSAAAVVAVVPLFLWALASGRGAAPLAALLFGLGLFLGLADQVRAYSGTSVLLFAALALLLRGTVRPARRLLLGAALVAGTLLPGAAVRSVVAERDAYLARAGAEIRRPEMGNVLWHSIYIGFGYLPNDRGLAYLDEVAMAKVRSVDPGAPYLSPRYTDVLRGAVLGLAREEPLFVLRTLAAKGAVVLGVVLVFANVGLLLGAAHRPGWRTHLPFWAAMGFTALPGLIAIPALYYLLGTAAFATLYGLVMMDGALEAGVLRGHPTLRGWPRTLSADAP